MPYEDGYAPALERNTRQSLANLQMAQGGVQLQGALAAQQAQSGIREVLSTIGDNETPDQTYARLKPFGQAGIDTIAKLETIRQHRAAGAEAERKTAAATGAQAHLQQGVARFLTAPAPGSEAPADWKPDMAGFGRHLLANAATAPEGLKLMGEMRAENKPIVLPQGSSLASPTGNVIAKGNAKPMVEHNYPVADNQVQPHISLDSGQTWNPIPGSQPSAKFARQVAPVIKVGGDTAKYQNVQADGKGGFIGLNKNTGRMEAIPQTEAVTAPATLSGDALDSAAGRYKLDGTLPPNLGRGIQGQANTVKILNRAAEMARDAGDTPEAGRIGQLAAKANAGALNELSKRESQVSAFERTFVKNTQLVESLSDKVDRTGVPILNKWINSGKRAVLGDPDLSSFDAAIKGAVNEYTKIVSGSMGNVAMAEGEIKKIEDLLSAAQTPEQVKAVLKTMRTETQNRMSGFAEQKAELMQNFKGAAGKRAADKPGAVLRFDAQGNPVQ